MMSHASTCWTHHLRAEQSEHPLLPRPRRLKSFEAAEGPGPIHSRAKPEATILRSFRSVGPQQSGERPKANPPRTNAAQGAQGSEGRFGAQGVCCLTTWNIYDKPSLHPSECSGTGSASRVRKQGVGSDLNRLNQGAFDPGGQPQGSSAKSHRCTCLPATRAEDWGEQAARCSASGQKT